MSDVADTASVIARVRAEENFKPEAERLFRDPFAHLFAGGEGASRIAKTFDQVPFFREAVVVRTRFIDDALRSALERGVRQILLLGAGFDCRALRLEEIAAAGAVVFEVDFAEQLEAKRAILRLAPASVPDWNVYVASDFTRAAFSRELAGDLERAGYRRTEAVFCVCEGVVNYLEPGEIDRALSFPALHGAGGSELVFNYLRLRVDPATLSERLAALGFSDTKTWSLGDLYRTYYGEKPVPELQSVADEFFVSLGVV